MKYIDILVNGEIYLKRGTSTLEPIKKLQETIDYENTEDEDFEIFNSLLDNLKKKHTDYSGTTSFWQLFTNDGSSIMMKACRSLLKKYYYTKESMEQDFIKLTDFLEYATFVGREFKRTKPVVIDNNIRYSKYKEDKSYMGNVDSFKYIVLYATQELFLIKRICNGKEEYGLINSKYTLDGNYVFFGEVYEEYKDKEKVYSEVFKQVTEENKKHKRR